MQAVHGNRASGTYLEGGGGGGGVVGVDRGGAAPQSKAPHFLDGLSYCRARRPLRHSATAPQGHAGQEVNETPER